MDVGCSQQDKLPRITILSGAGLSAESGLSTFRDSDGLWENYKIEDVASLDAWERDPELVLSFYNMRRRQANLAEPNGAHIALARLAEHYHVDIITQNVDDLHERAGSGNITHLHGKLNEVRPVSDTNEIGYQGIPWTGDLHIGDVDPRTDEQLRPHIVWFGEGVPNIIIGEELVKRCDHLIVIGTSLNVYPAAGLIELLPEGATYQVIDTDKDLVSKLESMPDMNTDQLLISDGGDDVTTAELVNKLVDDFIIAASKNS
ncbi:MAG: Sir2 family NAD-dependent protein deacetylase [Bacteroidota bacterium]